MSVTSKTAKRLVLWGLGPVNQALAQCISNHADIEIVGIVADLNTAQASDLPKGIPLLPNHQITLPVQADCVILEPDAVQPAKDTDQLIERILASGNNLICTVPHSAWSGSDTDNTEDCLKQACLTGNSTFHATGLFPQLLTERFALTLGKALSKVEHVRVIQAVDCSMAPAEIWGGINALGLGKPDENTTPDQHPLARSVRNSMQNVALQLYGKLQCEQHGQQRDQQRGTLRTDCTTTTVSAKKKQAINGIKIDKGDTVALSLVHRAWMDDHLFLTCETHWYLGEQNAVQGEDIPYGNFNTPYSFTVSVAGEPSRLDAQLELEPVTAGINPLARVTAQGILAAIDPVCAATPGILLNDAAPRYQLDDRLPFCVPQPNTHTGKVHREKPYRPPYRIVIWGPGEIGGAVTRAALQRNNLQIVGAKVFSPHKHGKDLGELVGIGPIGVKATLSADEIKALKPDCVIMAPQPRAIVEGLDNDVLDLLEAGINVITSAAYHNVTMPNWLVSSQTPMQLLKEVADISGMAQNKTEEIAFAINAQLMRRFGNTALARALTPVVNTLLTPAVNKAMPFRATPEQIMLACRKGRSSLHGTGVHPTFMAERVGMQLATMVEEAQHVRFVEAADFSYMPDGMWGGLSGLGFGKPVEELDENYLIARAGDFYYGDVTGNVAHLLHGVPSSRVRVERSFRALPAERDFMVGSTPIRKGCAAALHMVHKGYIGDHHFFTNEECWYLGPEKEFRGDDLPFGNFKTPISYTVEVTGKPSCVRMQLSMDGTGAAAEIFNNSDNSTADKRCALGQKMRQSGITNPITNATAMAILDAVGPVCDMAPGVAIDDIRPGFRHC